MISKDLAALQKGLMLESQTNTFNIIAQQNSGGAYAAGQIIGVFLMTILTAAILWRFVKRK